MKNAEILLPGRLSHGFDYAVPDGMTLAPGDFVRVPFGKNDAARRGVGAGQLAARGRALKSISAHYAHLPPMTAALREIRRLPHVVQSPRLLGTPVLRCMLPVPEALELPTARERKPAAEAPLPPQAAALFPRTAERRRHQQADQRSASDIYQRYVYGRRPDGGRVLIDREGIGIEELEN